MQTLRLSADEPVLCPNFTAAASAAAAAGPLVNSSGRLLASQRLLALQQQGLLRLHGWYQLRGGAGGAAPVYSTKKVPSATKCLHRSPKPHLAVRNTCHIPGFGQVVDCGPSATPAQPTRTQRLSCQDECSVPGSMKAERAEDHLKIGGSAFMEGLIGAEPAAGARPVIAVDKDAAVEAALPARCILRIDETISLSSFKLNG